MAHGETSWGSSMSEPVIDVSELTRRFGATTALDSVSLSLPRGAVYGLVGANGAGKTTLIRHVLGLLRAESGSVRVFGLDPVADPKGVLSRIDPDTNAPVAESYVAGGARAVVAGEGALWITSEEGDRLTRVNPHNNEVVETIAVGPKPGRLAVGEGGVWTLNTDGTVTRVDPSTNKVVATITVGGDTAKGDIAAGVGSVWVSTPGAPIIRIDPRTNRAVQRFTGEGGGAILVAHGSLWVAASPQTTWRLDPQLVAAVRP